MLIAIEGIHGAGKTTLINYLVEHLDFNIPIRISKWNSYENIHPYIYQYRLKGLLNDKYTYFLMQLADFACRYYTDIKSHIGTSDTIVFADRYIHTGWVRGITRGIDEEYVKHAYSFADPPDLEILVDVSESTSFCRRRPSNDSVWMIGMNRHTRRDKFSESEYLEYLRDSRELYLRFSKTENTVVINQDFDEYDLHKIVTLVNQLYLCKFH